MVLDEALFVTLEIRRVRLMKHLFTPEKILSIHYLQSLLKFIFRTEEIT